MFGRFKFPEKEMQKIAALPEVKELEYSSKDKSFSVVFQPQILRLVSIGSGQQLNTEPGYVNSTYYGFYRYLIGSGKWTWEITPICSPLLGHHPHGGCLYDTRYDLQQELKRKHYYEAVLRALQFTRSTRYGGFIPLSEAARLGADRAEELYQAEKKRSRARRKELRLP